MISKKGNLTNLEKSPYGKESYDSALEREYMVELERDPAVIRWTKKHNIKIPYKFLGFTKHYYPDFLVEYKDGHKEIHETKGLPLLLWASTKIKGQTADEFVKEKGWRYKIITKGRQAFYNKF
ncbi:MAG: TnsA endonuclease N-terminal domain-containing protein [Candidatus Nealsonbacteria bacterium]